VWFARCQIEKIRKAKKLQSQWTEAYYTHNQEPNIPYVNTLRLRMLWRLQEKSKKFEFKAHGQISAGIHRELEKGTEKENITILDENGHYF